MISSVAYMPQGSSIFVKSKWKPNSGSFSSQWKEEQMISYLKCPKIWNNVIFPGAESKEMFSVDPHKKSFVW